MSKQNQTFRTQNAPQSLQVANNRLRIRDSVSLQLIFSALMERCLSERASWTQIDSDNTFEEDGKHSESKECWGRVEDDELRQMKLMYTISVRHIMNGATEESNTKANIRSNRLNFFSGKRKKKLIYRLDLLHI